MRGESLDCLIGLMLPSRLSGFIYSRRVFRRDRRDGLDRADPVHPCDPVEENPVRLNCKTQSAAASPLAVSFLCPPGLPDRPIKIYCRILRLNSGALQLAVAVQTRGESATITPRCNSFCHFIGDCAEFV